MAAHLATALDLHRATPPSWIDFGRVYRDVPAAWGPKPCGLTDGHSAAGQHPSPPRNYAGSVLPPVRSKALRYSPVVPVSLKYAVVERERRFLVGRIPDGVTRVSQITDRYLEGTRLRLREVVDGNGTVTRKVGHKVRLTDGPDEVACTSMYLDDAEWGTLIRLPARTLRKTRHVVARDGVRVAVDRFEHGTLLAEIDDGDRPPVELPGWLDVIRDVSHDERWTGAQLAH